MKKTYRHSRRSNKTRVTKKYTARRARRVHKAHKSHRMQKGGAFNYELDVSTDLNVVFITYKTIPRIIYKIDLPSRTFSIFTAGSVYETYPLDKKYDKDLFKILNHAKINDYRFEDLLIDKGIDNIEHYPDDGKLVRQIPKQPKQALHQMKKIEEELLAESPKAVVEQVDVLQEIPMVASPKVSPKVSPKASPRASPRVSPRSKTVKNRALSRRTKEGLRAAVKLAEVITDDKIERVHSGNVRVKTARSPTIAPPSFRLPTRDRLPFKP